jgi:hypothetical protein
MYPEFFEESIRLADGLVASATQSGDGCTWLVSRPGSTGQARTVRVLAEGELYQGTAGIALFLMEAYACTGEARYLQKATAAMRHADRTCTDAATYALYSGRGGVAYAAARLAAITKDAEWHDLSMRHLAGITSQVKKDVALDIIGGSAGAILAMLAIFDILEEPVLIDYAAILGERLMSTAERRRGGWSWPTSILARQNLCGYAHGASGFAHAFLELFAVTGEERWRFAAARSMDYETAHFLPEVGDWLDLRNVTLNEILREPGGLAEARDRLQGGERLCETPARSMRAWCHGAPGITLVRIRALSLGVRTAESDLEARAGLIATRAHLASMRESEVSLCHGAFGNAEAVLASEAHLGIECDEHLRNRFRELVVRKQQFSKQWPSGTLGGGYDASLLVGEAGIGHQLLRLARPEVPSALFISSWCQRAPGHADIARPMRSEIAVLLPRTTAALVALPGAQNIRERMALATDRAASIPEALHATRAAVDAEEPGELAVCLRDALKLDEAALDAYDEFDDFVVQWCREILRPSTELPQEDERSRFVLASTTRILWSDFRWSEWSSLNGALPDKGIEASVVFRRGKQVVLQPIVQAIGIVLEGLSTPRTMAEAVEALQERLDEDDRTSEALPQFVRSVIVQAVNTGMVDLLRDTEGGAG